MLTSAAKIAQSGPSRCPMPGSDQRISWIMPETMENKIQMAPKMIDCIACELSNGHRALPGGLIHRSTFWLVEHCIGPLGLGTLIVKPERHVTFVADLSEEEAAELGPLLRRTSHVACQLVEADQVYNCLWSHAGGERVHIHYVVQPVTKKQMSVFAAHGPNLQVAQFAVGANPDLADIERVAELARMHFSD